MGWDLRGERLGGTYQAEDQHVQGGLGGTGRDWEGLGDGFRAEWLRQR